jgi:hypothetical protein
LFPPIIGVTACLAIPWRGEISVRKSQERYRVKVMFGFYANILKFFLVIEIICYKESGKASAVEDLINKTRGPLPHIFDKIMTSLFFISA